MADGRVDADRVDGTQIAQPSHDLVRRDAGADHRAEVEEIAWAVDDDVLERRLPGTVGQDQLWQVMGRSRHAPQVRGRPVRRHGAWPGCQDGCGDSLLTRRRRSDDPGDTGMDQLELAVEGA
jgi:hypothetical protein